MLCSHASSSSPKTLNPCCTGSIGTVAGLLQSGPAGRHRIIAARFTGRQSCTVGLCARGILPLKFFCGPQIKLDNCSGASQKRARLRHPTFQPRKHSGLEPPLNAISRSNWSPESAEMRPLFCGCASCGWFPGFAWNWIAVHAVNNPTSTKSENQKNDSSILKKID